MLMALCGNLRQVSNAKYSVHAHPELSGIYHFKADTIVYLVCRAADLLSLYYDVFGVKARLT